MGPSLREIFTPLFSYVLLLTRGPAAQPYTFAAVRREIGGLLDRQRTLLKQYDIPAEDYDTARFAVVAWVDELILRTTHDTNRELYEQWKRSPLQVELYRTANAGEEVFDRIEQLRPGQKAVREVYHLCLCLGFHGRYYDETQEYKLAELRHTLAAQLPSPAVDLLEVEKRQERLTPQPYSVRAVPARRPAASLSFLWFLVAVPFLGAAGFYMYCLLYGSCGTPPDPLPAVRDRLAKLDCAQIEVSGYQDGVLSLRGRVHSQEQREVLRGELLQVPGITRVADSSTIIPRPFCQIIELLEPLQQRSRAAGYDVSIQPQKGCNTTYVRGEGLVFQVTARNALRYVYADYFAADRENVAHLLPNANQHDNLIKSSTLTLGGPGADPQWQVQPPFGMELITVITSAQPLLKSRTTAAEDDARYIAEIQRSIQDNTSSEMAATYCFITTEDK